MKPGICRVCGCTENSACVHEWGPCWWYDHTRTLCASPECVEAVQRQLYDHRNNGAIRSGEMPPFDLLSPESAAAVCTKCGEIADPEMPFDEGDPILCGGDICEEASE